MTIVTGFFKRAMAEVSVVGLTCGDQILMGKRRDNGKWTNPGGHLEKGEDPLKGAARELMEESGIKAKNLKYLISKQVTKPDGEKLKIHAYQMSCSEKPNSSMKDDPDNEVYRWQWVSKKLSENIRKNLHVPKGNVLFDALKIAY